MKEGEIVEILSLLLPSHSFGKKSMETQTSGPGILSGKIRTL